QLSGQSNTGASTSTFQLMNDFFNLLSDMTFGGGGGGAGIGGTASGFAPEERDGLPADVALAYDQALGKAPAAQSFAQRWNAWGSAYGGNANYNGNAAIGSNNVNASDYGFAGGLDYYAAPDLKLGFALAGAGTNWHLSQNLGSGRSDVFQAAGYAIQHFGPAYISGMAAFGNSWFTTNRTAAFGDQLRAKFDGQSYALRAETGYRFAVLPTVGITPYGAVQTQWFRTPAYSETDLNGGGFALSYNAMTSNDTRSELGARADDLAMLGAMPMVLRARVAWAHDWVSNPALGAVFQALPGAAFTVNGAAIPANSALASAGAQLFFTPNWSVEAKFNGEFASTAQTYAGTGTLKYSW
ncbi:MAG TPA: autotransporter outer membrane beta-barrel domain-containing protein, partial [Xanthobacteraceae bacterium]